MARAERGYGRLLSFAYDESLGLDTHYLLRICGGLMAELFLEYENPGDVYARVCNKLSKSLSVCPSNVGLIADMSPPPHVWDSDLEFGREFARELDLDNIDDLHHIQDIFLDILVSDILCWEKQGLDRVESLTILLNSIRFTLSLELAAQEICDHVIEGLVGQHYWTLQDCIIGLSALAGQRMALCSPNVLEEKKPNQAFMVAFDQVAFIMAQEASRLGVPCDANWKWKAAANDTNSVPPTELISKVDPICISILDMMSLKELKLRAAAVAKAAGRMVAVAAGGEIPELEPNVAKPLAIMAMKETYNAHYNNQEAS